ncbi:heme-binding domain-containing protein [Actinospongicola halichondriae]|uniref:heme-binding domain-containing protein n=1 Tax=Actinospongicola halichondriae TaxID=3236844 RepID=UPI003D4A3188
MGPTARALYLRFRLVIGIVLFVALAMQFVPYGWDHSNPPVVDPVRWPSAEAERVARASCYDCHSNETEWPIYSYVAPMSWLVRHDVDEGRSALNFSEWDDFDSEADDAAEEIITGSMPPAEYVRLHPDASLNQVEKRLLIDALAEIDERD